MNSTSTWLYAQAELLPAGLGPDPARQEGLRSLFRLDLLRLLLHAGGGGAAHTRALQRRREWGSVASSLCATAYPLEISTLHQVHE